MTHHRLAMTIALLITAALGGCGPITFVVGLAPGDRALRETVLEEDGRLGGDRVALIDVTGVLINANKPGLLDRGENPVSLLYEKLAKAEDDPRVKAVVLRLNTPGGAVTASDAMYRELQRFRERTGKPVVALLMDVAASGGYYVACASDRIVAYPTSVTGSIGVIVQTISVKPALQRLGVMTEAMTSGPNKDAGSPLSVLTDEHRAVLQQLVDDFYARFVEVVREARPGIPPDRFDEVTDGRVVSGEVALEHGLVDATGDLHDALAVARDLAGLDRADVVQYHRPLDYVGSPYAAAPATPAVGTQVNLLQMNLDAAGLELPVGFYYLWRPDLH